MTPWQNALVHCGYEHLGMLQGRTSGIVHHADMVISDAYLAKSNEGAKDMNLIRLRSDRRYIVLVQAVFAHDSAALL